MLAAPQLLKHGSAEGAWRSFQDGSERAEGRVTDGPSGLPVETLVSDVISAYKGV